MRRFIEDPRLTFAILLMFCLTLTAVIADTAYYGFGSDSYGIETNKHIDAYSVPIVEAISSSTVVLLQNIIGSSRPKFAIVHASEDFYLNGTVATPTLGLKYLKNTSHLIPVGNNIKIITAADSANLKVLPIQ